MDTLDKEFWEKREAAMKRFMAAKERKKARVAEIKSYRKQISCSSVHNPHTSDSAVCHPTPSKPCLSLRLCNANSNIYY